MIWLNQPAKWNAERDSLSLTTDPKTDFWRKTHYGFIRDNGHFFYETVSGEFVVETEFKGNYHALYDQAGLMIRADETTWLKTGIEFVESVQYISAVVTRDYSDWSVVKLSAPIRSLRLRATQKGGSIIVEYDIGTGVWTMLRTTFLSSAPVLQVGRMAASPDGPGFDVQFHKFSITQQT
jgi:regulation of enolase protein 1 (concanavalin A-like superfamily)